MNEKLLKFEKKCIQLGELHAAQQVIRFTVYLESGKTIQREIVGLVKEIDKLKKEILDDLQTPS